MRLFMSVAIIIPALLFVLAACQSMKHDIAAADAGGPGEAGKVSVCRLCYTEIEQVRRRIAPGKGPKRWVTHRTHPCDECKSEATIYTREDGTLMIRCAKCAPEGLACDRCTPAQN